jgi:hypothetical protein
MHDASCAFVQVWPRHWVREIPGHEDLSPIIAKAIKRSPMLGPIFEAVNDTLTRFFVPIKCYKNLKWDQVQQLMHNVVLFYFLHHEGVSACLWKVAEAMKALDAFVLKCKGPLEFSVLVHQGMRAEDKRVAEILAEKEAEECRDAKCNTLRDKVAEAEKQLIDTVADALKCIEGDGTGLQPECTAFREYFSLFMQLVADMQKAKDAMGDNEKATHRQIKDELVAKICTGTDAFISHFVKVQSSP